jgi:hypothetical protein
LVIAASAADWLTATGTAAAAVIATVALLLTVLTQRRQVELERRRQASNVTLGVKDGRVRCFNGNAIPMYLFAVEWRNRQTAETVVVHRPLETAVEAHRWALVGRVTPELTDCTPRVLIRDGNGLWWIRDARAGLEPIAASRAEEVLSAAVTPTT